MSARFVVVEGLDGSGKSTLAGLVAQELGGIVMSTPNAAVRAVRSQVVAGLTASPVARQAFYLATVEAASETIRGHLAAGRSVVLDRYLLSTMVYAEARGAHLRWPELERRLLPAHVTLFMDVPREVRERRMQARGMTAADVETLDPAFDAAVRAGYDRWSTHRVVGRWQWMGLAGDESAEEVAEFVARYLV